MKSKMPVSAKSAPSKVQAANAGDTKLTWRKSRCNEKGLAAIPGATKYASRAAFKEQPASVIAAKRGMITAIQASYKTANVRSTRNT